MGNAVVGLTGPTGAGKSTVCAVWARMGCAVVDADRVAREAAGTPDCLAALQREYGADIVTGEGTLDRGLLAVRAFATKEKTARLNEITHPVILGMIAERLERLSKTRTVVLDAPLLFESGAQRFCAKTVAVIAPREIRLSRVMKRDGITAEQAAVRMAAQQADSYYISRADFVLDGSLPLAELTQAAQNLLARLIGESNEAKFT